MTQPYNAMKLTEGQGFDWVITFNGNILTSELDGKPERYDSESLVKSTVAAKNAEATASELDKLVADRLQAACSTPIYRTMLLRMAQAAVRAVEEYNAKAKTNR